MKKDNVSINRMNQTNGMKLLRKRKLLICMYVFCISFFPLFGAKTSEVAINGKQHRIPAATGSIKIDGQLNDSAWQEALKMELGYEVEPGENINAPVRTQVLILSGVNHLYVGFRAYDPEPSAIRARYTDRDNIWNDDYVGIVLDTFNDSRLTHNFYSNPLGIQADQIVVIGQNPNEWDAIWKSAGRITPEGYIVEMSIPLSSLRFQRKRGQQVWGFDVVRSYPRSLSHMIGLFPRDRSNNCYMCQAEKMIGFEGATPGKNLEFDPTVSALITRERESYPDGNFVKKDSKIDPGLTARWGITPNLTLSAAINPDFSHVEADVAQLDINNQYALFYPEKRPFFLEGSNIFLSRFYAIYTRTIADPDWGIKLTGKEGRHSIGFFMAHDTTTNLILPSRQSSYLTSINQNNLSSALRYRYDLGRSSTVGVVLTDREGDDYFNRLGGVDADIRFSKKDRLWFQFLGSQTRYPGQIVEDFNQPGGQFSGGAFDMMYWHTDGHLTYFLHYQNVEEKFRADVGFADMTDNILVEAGGGYAWRHNPGHWYTQLSFLTRYIYETDHQKSLLRKGSQTRFIYRGPLQSSANILLDIGKKMYLGHEFSNNVANFWLQLRPSGSFLLGVNGSVGDRVDFANIRQGTVLRLNPLIQYNVGRHLYLGFDHVYERLDVEGGRLYTANLSNLRLIYQFNSRTFLRGILQYANYNRDTSLYGFPIDPKFKHLFSQVLFSYKINPQTVLFLGYSDDYLGYQYMPIKQNNYTFFLKIGYALVL